MPTPRSRLKSLPGSAMAVLPSISISTQKNDTIPWSHFSQQEKWIKTCNVSFTFVVPGYEAFRVKKNGSHCMPEWCGWLEKNKIAWLSQDDGDAPLTFIIWRTENVTCR